MALAAVAIIASVIAVAAIATRKEPRELPTARFVLTLPRGGQFGSATQTVFAISPDGKWIVGRARIATNQGTLFLRSIDNTRIIPLPGTELSLNAWFSPDGRWVGFATPNALAKVSVATHDIVQIMPIRGIYGGAAFAPDGRIVTSMENSRLVVAPDNGNTPKRLCGKSGDHLIVQVGPVILADGETVLFSAATTSSLSNSKLAVGSLRTGECRLLDMPAIQPLGVVDDIVAFATLSGVIMAARFNQRTKNVEGNAIPLVSDVDVNQTTGSAQAGMSASGSLVYLTASGTNRLMKIDMRGQAAPVTSDERSYAYPRYSPDGRKIAIAIATAGQRDIWVIDVGGKTISPLTSGGSINDRPEWSPDGSRILYRTSRTARSAIWWRSSDLSDDESPVLSSDKEDYYEGVITPDGKSLIYQVDTAGADIIAQSLSGDRKKTTLVATQFIEDMGRVSPDGKWLAYVTNASGANEVVVQPYPGPGARVQVSNHGGEEPVWSPTESKLYYRDEQSLVGVSFRAAPGFEVTGRQTLFPDVFLKRTLPHANYDIAPDGKSFLFLQSTSDNEGIVVYNWIAEVRARLKESRDEPAPGR
jgi:Tol biopolymer transport system component